MYETVHLLIPKGYQPKNNNSNLFSKFKGLFSQKSKAVKISLDSLKNQKIASWGGSVVQWQKLLVISLA